ncbi:nuclear transport factor 2 family protein [Psychrobium sp. 1_MG-2023]|uniref:nuclear transport factor 2 family protein n=1 Tax=Psychrobium sp. 1_MG-2023 TaxID=3062624 RepID=UPI000C3365A7|nr:nuclear transport factor 2 family protein [Psychrobium sp. 1_MG-2023]MDP2562155.1 nuclear transport factor 2 family protein [Psychrobium sp. 1_MG-2023]PKF57173.1 transcriptional regulator [Alteromonadales bacterium alter-6D02]
MTPRRINQQAEWPFWLKNFIDVYQVLSTDNLELLGSIYHKDVTFLDPIHQVNGLDNLQQYFSNLYQNLSQCDFLITDAIVDGDQAALYWQMTYTHRSLNGGREVVVTGTSRIKGKNNKVIHHQDYLDVGAMLYEQLPVIGRVIQWIKAKAVK